MHLGSKSVDYMTADHLGPEIANYLERTDPTRAGYGFRPERWPCGARPAAPASWVPRGISRGAARTAPISGVDPKEQLVVVFMAHTPGPMRLHYRKVINALVLQAIVD